jgi:hypothetical protein
MIQKEYAIIQNGEVVRKADTELELIRAGYDIGEIVVLPKPHKSMYV